MSVTFEIKLDQGKHKAIIDFNEAIILASNQENKEVQDFILNKIHGEFFKSKIGVQYECLYQRKTPLSEKVDMSRLLRFGTDMLKSLLSIGIKLEKDFPTIRRDALREGASIEFHQILDENGVSSPDIAMFLDSFHYTISRSNNLYGRIKIDTLLYFEHTGVLKKYLDEEIQNVSDMMFQTRSLFFCENKNGAKSDVLRSDADPKVKVGLELLRLLHKHECPWYDHLDGYKTIFQVTVFVEMGIRFTNQIEIQKALSATQKPQKIRF